MGGGLASPPRINKSMKPFELIAEQMKYLFEQGQKLAEEVEPADEDTAPDAPTNEDREIEP